MKCQGSADELTNVKSLRHLIKSKRPGKEVRDVLSKVQEACEKLIRKHEELTKLIEDGKEFE